MSAVSEAQSEVQSALTEAVQGFKLPAEVMGQAAQLLTRLNQPTRVSLLGLPKTGKTGIFNLLAGQEILPEGLGATVQLVHGSAPKAHVTLPDGTNLSLEGAPDLERIGAMTPVFVKLEMDLPALRKISLLEVATGADREAQQRAIKWAMKQTDIGIWCTEDFTATEQALWAGATDEVKDHAILLRTRADLISEDRKAVVDGLRDALQDSFAFFMAVSGQEAKAARAGESVDKAQMKASGASALISTILRQIERGRQTAVDQAHILLLKYEDTDTAQDAPKADAPAAVTEAAPVAAAQEVAQALKEEATPDAVVEQALPDTAAAPETETPVDLPVEASVATPVDAPVTKAAPEGTSSGPQTADDFAFFASARASMTQGAVPMAALFGQGSSETQEVQAADQAVEGEGTEAARAEADVDAGADADADVKAGFTLALDRLSDTGEAIATFDPSDTKKILRACEKTLEWLALHLEEGGLPQVETVETLQSMTQDASDLIQLLKAEGGEEASQEAVTALLQIKRYIQADLSA